ncbi:hypothetical protein [Virgibacillus salexigens]
MRSLESYNEIFAKNFINGFDDLHMVTKSSNAISGASISTIWW